MQPLKITRRKKGTNRARKRAILSQVSRRRGHNIAFAARIARLSMEEDWQTAEGQWEGRERRVASGVDHVV